MPRSYLPYLLLLFGIALVLRVDFYFSIIYLFFLVYLLARLWLQQVMAGLRIERGHGDRAFIGDRIKVSLTVHNTSRLPVPWLRVLDVLPIQLSTPPFYRRVLSLAPGERRRLDYTLICRRRGYYRLGPLTVESGDLLGILPRRRLAVTPDGILIVYPRVLPLQRLGLPTRSPLARRPTSRPLFEDPDRVTGIRPYQRGDSPRRIHWPATASSGRIVVKQFDPGTARETIIFLDLDERHYERGLRLSATETAITIAASLANHSIVQEKMAVGLVTEGWDAAVGAIRRVHLPPGTERSHLMVLLERLSRLSPSSEVQGGDLFRQVALSLSYGTTVVYVSGEESGIDFAPLLHLRRMGFPVSVIAVQHSQLSTAGLGRARSFGISLTRVWTDEELEGGL